MFPFGGEKKRGDCLPILAWRKSLSRETSRMAVQGAPSSCSSRISLSATRLSVSRDLPLQTVAYVPCRERDARLIHPSSTNWELGMRTIGKRRDGLEQQQQQQASCYPTLAQQSPQAPQKQAVRVSTLQKPHPSDYAIRKEMPVIGHERVTQFTQNTR